MSDERLTKWIGIGYGYAKGVHTTKADKRETLNKLGRYEDKQEQGLLVEIVRCGECKHWRINLNNLYGGQCRYSECANIGHYCSYGKRKTREEAEKALANNSDTDINVGIKKEHKNNETTI